MPFNKFAILNILAPASAAVEEKKEKIERRVAYMLKEQVEADKREGKDLEERTKRDKYIEKLRKQAARVEEFLKKNEPKPKHWPITTRFVSRIRPSMEF